MAENEGAAGFHSHARQQLMKAEMLEILSHSNKYKQNADRPVGYPEDPETLVKIFQEELEDLCDSLDDIKSEEEGELRRLRADNKQLQADDDVAKEMLEMLSGNVEASNNAASITQDTVFAEYDRQYRENLSLLRTAVHKCNDFTDKQFPPPTQVNDSGEVPYSMLEIVQKLIDRYRETPEDMYMTVGQRYLPHYVEGLVRYKIAERHPNDSRLIRIVPSFE